MNGRVAIIDDNINQARPLIDVLSSKQLPYAYYSGELKHLPNKDSFCNDIRVLFLDINLIDDSEHEDKVLRARLVPVLLRVISPNNFPFVVVYWSRNENHKQLIKDIFDTDLNDRKPIGYLEERKINYFNYDGTPAEIIEESINQLFQRVDDLFNKNPAFAYLLHWENLVHISSDITLEDVFSFPNSANTWDDEANYLFNKLGKSYSGKYYDNSSPEEKINSSFQSLNSVLIDSLEYSVNTVSANFPQELTSKIINDNVGYTVNKKLLTSTDTNNIKYSGIVLTVNNANDEKEYSELINNLIFSNIKSQVYVSNEINSNSEIDKDLRNKLDKLVSSELKVFKDSSLKQTFNILLNVTPLCDFVQKKQKYDRWVKGILLESKFRYNIDEKSEAIFTSPNFSFNGLSYFLVLDFKYFFTSNSINEDNFKLLFRLRQQVVSEVQSKLARHIGRQGILFLETK